MNIPIVLIPIAFTAYCFYRMLKDVESAGFALFCRPLWLIPAMASWIAYLLLKP